MSRVELKYYWPLSATWLYFVVVSIGAAWDHFYVRCCTAYNSSYCRIRVTDNPVVCMVNACKHPHKFTWHTLYLSQCIFHCITTKWMKKTLCFRQGLGSSYLPPRETAGQCEQLQPDSLYSSRGLYADELPSSARPRPVGGTTGTHGNCTQTHAKSLVFMSTNTVGFRCCSELLTNGMHMF